MGLLTPLSRWYRYSLARLSAPHWSDFAEMGIGIEARYARCARWWNPHLEASRSFVRNNLPREAGIKTIHVFGAGRLLDIDCEYLSGAATDLTLYDVDPTASRCWPRGAHLHHNILDLSGVLSVWTKDLEKFLSQKSPSISDLVSFLLSLPPPHLSSLLISPRDAVLSVNILSQLPVYWRNRLERLLHQYWGYTTDAQGNFQHEVQAALDGTYRRLQADHLNLCARGERLLLITDDFFAYYRKDLSPWQIEKALYVDVAVIDGMVCTHFDTWLWHIAPQGVEHEAYGEIHRVVARSFVRE